MLYNLIFRTGMPFRNGTGCVSATTFVNLKDELTDGN